MGEGTGQQMTQSLIQDLKYLHTSCNESNHY